MQAKVTVPFRLIAYGATDVGRKRKHNEDVIVVRDDLALYAVCDGAGGHNRGDVAAALAARSLSNYFGATHRFSEEAPLFDKFGNAYDARRLAAGIRKANLDLMKVSASNEQYEDMVSTVVAACISQRSEMLHVAYVGDSRCYRLRSCRLEQLTRDHSLLSEVLEREPDLDDKIVENMRRNVVTRALGKEENVMVSFQSFALLPGDRVMLCSDGLSGMLDRDTIEAVLCEPEPPESIVKKLIHLANEAGGKDNISVIVVDVEDNVGLENWDDEQDESEETERARTSSIPEIEVG